MGELFYWLFIGVVVKLYLRNRSQTVNCYLQVWEELLPQAMEFKYLRILFTSDLKMEREMDRRYGVASVVMETLYWKTLIYVHMV